MDVTNDPEAGSVAVAVRAHEAERFEPVVENGGGTSRFVLLCDHASNACPPGLGDLGLAQADWQAHIAWDPGALAVARRLSRLLDAPLVHAAVSRLVLDCNRAPDARDLVPAFSGGIRIAGNEGLPPEERARRIAAVHEPYHDGIERVLAARLAAGSETALVAVHSFTPVLGGVARPWHVGILFGRDRRLADRCLATLRAEPGLVVGENEPYSPRDGVYYTLGRHGEARGLPSVMIEIRNDLIAEEEGQASWAERIARALDGEGAGHA
ncbi:N-formylglutamate amidohydrolase [Propylenella binzhouense]|uniref:N-formylglutamate amidohydrolase n=1 Tax=Propylenella binzhouense TaxID=2555902 RepID=A0A964T489_9HYPH|nr:N-formylglutamate amidohydrolase [Propylenella binzhouense]MYZ48211.1 N-formylglutamate amidohydrolase [Propylenella binzhouense]